MSSASYVLANSNRGIKEKNHDFVISQIRERCIRKVSPCQLRCAGEDQGHNTSIVGYCIYFTVYMATETVSAGTIESPGSGVSYVTFVSLKCKGDYSSKMNLKLWHNC